MAVNIVIKVENKDRIEEAIRKVEGRATARTIDFEIILKSIEKIEDHLGIAKKDMTGCEATVDFYADDFPQAYKWTPESTQFHIKKTASGWNLISVYRAKCGRYKERYFVSLTEEAKKAVLEKAARFV